MCFVFCCEGRGGREGSVWTGGALSGRGSSSSVQCGRGTMVAVSFDLNCTATPEVTKCSLGQKILPPWYNDTPGYSSLASTIRCSVGHRQCCCKWVWSCDSGP
jgi:hypothetical protein